MRLELSKRIFLNFVVVIAAFFILAALLGVSLINRNILNKAQRRVRLNLRSGWSVIHSEINQIGLFVSTLGPGRGGWQTPMARLNPRRPGPPLKLPGKKPVLIFCRLPMPGVG